MARALAPDAALALLGFAAGCLVAGAWFFQLVVKLAPCPLCLTQRWPHYAALAVSAPLAWLVFRAQIGASAARAALGLLSIIFIVSTGLGLYHAGVEWGVFQGPADCAAAAAAPAVDNMADFMRQLQSTRVTSCATIPWSFLGLSLAGWNAVASAGLAAFAAIAALRSAP